MNSKSTGADMVYAWETSEIGMMDAALAAKIMYADADADVIKVKADRIQRIAIQSICSGKERICRYDHCSG